MRSGYLPLAATLAAGILVWAASHRDGPPPAGAEEPAPDRFEPHPLTTRVGVRLREKQRAVEALLAGEASLLAAAARFKELDAREPRVRAELFPELYAGDTEAEKYCRAVIVWADSVARRDPSAALERPAAEVVRRLEAELVEHLRQGTLVLPAVTLTAPVRPCLAAE